MSAYTYSPEHTLSEVRAGAVALGWTVTDVPRTSGGKRPWRDLVTPRGVGYRCATDADEWAALRSGGVVLGGLNETLRQFAEFTMQMYRETHPTAPAVKRQTVDLYPDTPDGVLSPAGRRQALGGGAACTG